VFFYLYDSPMYTLILQNIHRHISLTSEEEAYFVSILKSRKLRKRFFLVQAGDLCRSEFFVKSGCFRVFATDPQGNDHNIMFAVEDWWISDMQSYLTGMPATLNIEALEDSEVLYIDKVDLEDLYEKIPKFNKLFRILLQNAFVAHQHRIFTTISQTAEERYAYFIKKYPHFEQRIPQHHIASYLGVSPETLSRIRRQWLESNS
jgi:CRP-like cAMP-binding protein